MITLDPAIEAHRMPVVSATSGKSVGCSQPWLNVKTSEYARSSNPPPASFLVAPIMRDRNIQNTIMAAKAVRKRRNRYHCETDRSGKALALFKSARKQDAVLED